MTRLGGSRGARLRPRQQLYWSQEVRDRLHRGSPAAETSQWFRAGADGVSEIDVMRGTTRRRLLLVAGLGGTGKEGVGFAGGGNIAHLGRDGGLLGPAIVTCDLRPPLIICLRS